MANDDDQALGGSSGGEGASSSSETAAKDCPDKNFLVRARTTLTWKGRDHVAHVMWPDIVKSGEEFPEFNIRITDFPDDLDEAINFKARPLSAGDTVLWQLRLEDIAVDQGSAKIPTYFINRRKATVGEVEVPLLCPFKHVKFPEIFWDENAGLLQLVYWTNERLVTYDFPFEDCADQRAEEAVDAGFTPIVVEPRLNEDPSVGKDDCDDDCDIDPVTPVMYYAEGRPYLVTTDLPGGDTPRVIFIFMRPVLVHKAGNKTGRNEPVMDSHIEAGCLKPTAGNIPYGQSITVEIASYSSSTKRYTGNEVDSNGNKTGRTHEMKNLEEDDCEDLEGSISVGTKVEVHADCEDCPKDAVKYFQKMPEEKYRITQTTGGTDGKYGAHKETVDNNSVYTTKASTDPSTGVSNRTVVRVPYEKSGDAGMTAAAVAAGARVTGKVAKITNTDTGKCELQLCQATAPYRKEKVRAIEGPSGTLQTIQQCYGSNPNQYRGDSQYQAGYSVDVVPDSPPVGDVEQTTTYETMSYHDTSFLDRNGEGEVVGLKVHGKVQAVEEDTAGSGGNIDTFIESRDTTAVDKEKIPHIQKSMSVEEGGPTGSKIGTVTLSALKAAVGKSIELASAIGTTARDAISRNWLSLFSHRPNNNLYPQASESSVILEAESSRELNKILTVCGTAASQDNTITGVSTPAVVTAGTWEVTDESFNAADFDAIRSIVQINPPGEPGAEECFNPGSQICLRLTITAGENRTCDTTGFAGFYCADLDALQLKIYNPVITSPISLNDWPVSASDLVASVSISDFENSSGAQVSTADFTAFPSPGPGCSGGLVTNAPWTVDVPLNFTDLTEGPDGRYSIQFAVEGCDFDTCPGGFTNDLRFNGTIKLVYKDYNSKSSEQSADEETQRVTYDEICLTVYKLNTDTCEKCPPDGLRNTEERDGY